MSAGVPYTRYHPKWYRRRVSVWWWLQSWRYSKFVLRELTSLAVAFFAVILLWQLYALGQGPEAYARFSARLRTPLFLFLHGVVFVAVLFHCLTWLNLTPKAMVVRLRGKRVPDPVVIGVNYLAWLLTSVVVAWLLLRG
jgi:fumarate reductase subunit C